MRGTAKLPEVTRLHEKTVQAVARGEVRKLPRRSSCSKQVVEQRNITVDRFLWEWLIKISVDLRCVQILSESEVVIWNSPEQASLMRARKAA